MPPPVNLFSDTATRPTPAMRRFMCDAEVGDEQRREDPTVNRLQEQVADLLGKEAALFLPSGTMCNQIAFAVHCRAGDEIIMDATAHPLNFEGGGPAALAGALIRPLNGTRGIFTGEQVEAAIRPRAHFLPRTRAVSVEQTTNIPGGACWPLEGVHAVTRVARAHGLATHLDGARLPNAAVATGTGAKDFAEPFDSVWIDLSKGLGCPVGAVLAGSRDFIEAAWPWKHRLGGAMRQAGIIAAAGIYALEHHWDRLAEDHANAKLLAHGLAQVKGIALDPALVETNIVVFDVQGTGLTGKQFGDRMLEHGVIFSVIGPTTIRAVTHLDVSRGDVDRATGAVRKAIGT